MTDTLRLHALNTPAGLIERVLLHETRSPAYSHSYNRPDSLKAMRLMRQVIYNRLRHPEAWGAPKARSVIDVITIRSQFGAFADFPNLDADFMLPVSDMIRIADTPSDKRSAANRQHVLDAITAATELAAPADAVIKDVVAWRTQGSSSPGPRFRSVISLQGNTFYMVPGGK